MRFPWLSLVSFFTTPDILLPFSAFLRDLSRFRADRHWSFFHAISFNFHSITKRKLLLWWSFCNNGGLVTNPVFFSTTQALRIWLVVSDVRSVLKLCLQTSYIVGAEHAFCHPPPSISTPDYYCHHNHFHQVLFSFCPATQQPPKSVFLYQKFHHLPVGRCMHVVMIRITFPFLLYIPCKSETLPTSPKDHWTFSLFREYMLRPWIESLRIHPMKTPAPHDTGHRSSFGKIRSANCES